MTYEKIKFGNGEELNIDRFLKQKLDIVLKLQKKDFDVVFLVDGGEGSGKSTLAISCAYYLSGGKMTSYNIAEHSQDAITKLDKLPDGSVLVIDEGSLTFSSKDVMKREQRDILKILNVIRQKRMVLIIVAPLFFDLVKYISVDRSKFLLHVYPNSKDFSRGRFAYFSTKKKRILYMVGKKNFNSYLKPTSNFRGRFENFQPPFWDEYKRIKRRTLMESFKVDKPPTEAEIRRKVLVNVVGKFRESCKDVKILTLENGFGLSKPTIIAYSKEYQQLKVKN